MSFHDSYRPFRNYVRQFPLVPSLLHIWRFSSHVLYQQPLPRNYPAGIPGLRDGLRQSLYPWDLDVLSRELVLNCGGGGLRSLGNWNDLAKAMTMLRNLEGAAFAESGPGQSDVMLELHRIAHRQFPWRTEDRAATMMRSFKVFGTDAVNRVVLQQLGMSMRDYITLGIAVTGNFNNQFGGTSKQQYSVVGISKEASDEFFRRLVTTTADLKSATIREQRYDRDWAYAWNPLEARPLISFDPSHPEQLICPIPLYLLRRTSVGVFYDLVKNASFSNPFGNAFEQYIGEVIVTACNSDCFKILEEESFMVGIKKMHGVDWTLSDNTGHLFIEAKTKRLKVTAKTRLDAKALDEDLRVMAQAIVQHYRNINRCLDGLTRWKPDGLPSYPLILTLDEWYLFSPRIQEMLKRHILDLMCNLGMASEILETMPYTIGSAADFEVISQIINQVGVCAVMEVITAPERRGWTLLPLAASAFPEQIKAVDPLLFRNEFVSLFADITSPRRESA